MKNYCMGGIAAVMMAFPHFCYAAITPNKIQMAQKEVAEQIWETDWTEFAAQRNGIIKGLIEQEIDRIKQPSIPITTARLASSPTQEVTQAVLAPAAIKITSSADEQEKLKKINKIFESEKTSLNPDYENARDTALKLLENMTDAGEKKALKAIDDHILNAIKDKLEEVETHPFSEHYQQYSWAASQANELQELMQTKQEAQTVIDAYKIKHSIK